MREEQGVQLQSNSDENLDAFYRTQNRPDITFEETTPKGKAWARNESRNNTRQIFINQKVLESKFVEKAWSKPTVEGVTPLPVDQFKTLDEWASFVEEHEIAHSYFSKEEGESKADYENRINAIALRRYKKAPEPATSREGPEEEATVLDMDPNVDLENVLEEDAIEEGVNSFDWYTTTTNIEGQVGEAYVKVPLLVKDTKKLGIKTRAILEEKQPDLTFKPKVGDGPEEFKSTIGLKEYNALLKKPAKNLTKDEAKLLKTMKSRMDYRKNHEVVVANHLAKLFGVTREADSKEHLGEYSEQFAKQIIGRLPNPLLAALDKFISINPDKYFIPVLVDGVYKIQTDLVQEFGTPKYTLEKIQESKDKANDTRKFKTKGWTVQSRTPDSVSSPVQLDTLVRYGAAVATEQFKAKGTFVQDASQVALGFDRAILLLDAANYDLYYNGVNALNAAGDITKKMFKVPIALHNGKPISYAQATKRMFRKDAVKNIFYSKELGAGKVIKDIADRLQIPALDLPDATQSQIILRSDGVIIMAPEALDTFYLPTNTYNKGELKNQLREKDPALADLANTIYPLSREAMVAANTWNKPVILISPTTTPQEIRTWVEDNKVETLFVSQNTFLTPANPVTTKQLEGKTIKVTPELNDTNKFEQNIALALSPYEFVEGKKTLISKEDLLDMQQEAQDRKESRQDEIQEDGELGLRSLYPEGPGDKNYSMDEEGEVLSQISLSPLNKETTNLQQLSQKRTREQFKNTTVLPSNISAYKENVKRREARASSKATNSFKEVKKGFDYILEKHFRGGVNPNKNRTVININDLLNEGSVQRLLLTLQTEKVARRGTDLLKKSILLNNKRISPFELLKQQATDMRKNEKLGKFIKFSDQEIILVDFRDDMTKAQEAEAIAGFAHELGHGIMFNELDKTLAMEDGKGAVYNLLQAEWNKERANLSASHPWNGTHGFTEWYADKIGRVILDYASNVKNTGKATNGATAFLKRVANKIRTAWKDVNKVLKQRFGPKANIVVKDYVEKTIKTYKETAATKTPIVVQGVIFDMAVNTLKSVDKTVQNKIGANRLFTQVQKFIRNNPDLVPKDWSKALSHYLFTADNRLRTLFKNQKDNLAKMLYNQSSSIEAIGTLNARGKLINQRQNELKSILKPLEGNTLEIQKVLLDAERDVPASQLKTDMARQVRKYLEDFYNKNVEGSGHNDIKSHIIKFRENFYPRLLAIEAIRENLTIQTDLANLLRRYNGGLNPPNRVVEVWSETEQQFIKEEIPVTWEETIETIVSKEERNPDNAIDGSDAMAVGMAKERSKVFSKIPNEELRNINALEDPAIAILKYVEDMTKRMDYMDKVQTVVTAEDMNILNQRAKDGEISSTMRRALKLSNKVGSVAKGWQAAEIMVNRLDTVEQRGEAKDILRGMLGKAGLNMSKEVRTANSILLTLNVVAYLSLATIASLPDLAGSVLRSKDFSAFRTAFQEMKYYFNNREQMRQFSRDVGVIGIESMSALSINAGEMAYMNPGIEKFTDKFFHVIGLEAFTKFTRVFSLGMGEQFLLNEAKKASDSSLTQAQRDRAVRYLQELGVTVDDIKAWDSTKEKGTRYRQFIGESGQKVKMALGQFVDESIVRPNSAERPGWASNPYTALVWQLKSFFYAYGKNLVGGAIRETHARYAETGKVADAAVPFLIMGTAFLPLTMVGLELREWLKYLFPGGDESAFKTDDMPVGEYSKEILDRSGLFGPWGLLLPMIEAGEFGGSWWVPPLGPTAERIEDLVKGDVDWTTYLPGYSSFR